MLVRVGVYDHTAFAAATPRYVESFSRLFTIRFSWRRSATTTTRVADVHSLCGISAPPARYTRVDERIDARGRVLRTCGRARYSFRRGAALGVAL